MAFWAQCKCLSMPQGGGKGGYSKPPTPEDIPGPSHGRVFCEKIRSVYVVKGVRSLLTDLFLNRQNEGQISAHTKTPSEIFFWPTMTCGFTKSYLYACRQYPTRRQPKRDPTTRPQLSVNWPSHMVSQIIHPRHQLSPTLQLKLQQFLWKIFFHLQNCTYGSSCDKKL